MQKVPDKRYLELKTNCFVISSRNWNQGIYLSFLFLIPEMNIYIYYIDLAKP